MKVFESLERLKQEGPRSCIDGICHNIKFDEQQARYAWYSCYVTCFQEWEEYSGSAVYPVPSVFAGIGPVLAFQRATEETMWSTEHPYGQARWRLLDHCIKWFKERDT